MASGRNTISITLKITSGRGGVGLTSCRFGFGGVGGVDCLVGGSGCEGVENPQKGDELICVLITRKCGCDGVESWVNLSCGEGVENPPKGDDIWEPTRGP